MYGQIEMLYVYHCRPSVSCLKQLAQNLQAQKNVTGLGSVQMYQNLQSVG